MAESSPMHIDGLPTEVLSLIFRTVISASLYARSIGDKSYGPIDCPTLLASVCARWRRVTIGIPVLWSFIDFTRSSDSLRNLEHAKLYAERSQVSLVYVHLGKLSDDDNRRLTSPTRNVSEDMLALLRTIAPRVQSFALNFSHSQDAIETFASPRTESYGRAAPNFDARGALEPTVRASKRSLSRSSPDEPALLELSQSSGVAHNFLSQ
ncbi:hypothetical protein FS749_010451 [Ceratobasidium sp. UAMH 11750]|nr:hypothetical protein FS749_010451 [Ceratobasidium sp. UAMH 11750]